MSNPPISICVPVYNRYDCLHDLLISLLDSTVKPHRVLIIDNGSNPTELSAAVRGLGSRGCKLPIETHSPRPAYSLAGAWNYFLGRTRGENHIIANDDITFGCHSIEIMQSSTADLTFPVGIGFSCFMIRDSCIDKLGLFDESLSPGFAYFEDCDYQTRKDAYNLAHTDSPVTTIDLPNCDIHHKGQMTQHGIKSEAEAILYRHKFIIAQENYITKHGQLPVGLTRLTE